MKKAILFLCFVAFIACAKENNEDQCADPSLIRKVKIDNLDLQEVTYNDNCQLKESIERFFYKNYVYNSNNQVIKIEEKISLDALSCYMQPGSNGETFTDPRDAKVTSYSVLEYDANGNLTKKSAFFNNNNNPQLVSYQLYLYKDSRVDKIETYNPDGHLSSYYIYQYDDKGNVSQSDYYLISNATPVKTMSYIYQYDDKINPYRIFECEGAPGKYTNMNNITSEKLIHYNGVSQIENQIDYIYEYNNLGYPTKVNNNSYIYGN